MYRASLTPIALYITELMESSTAPAQMMLRDVVQPSVIHAVGPVYQTQKARGQHTTLLQSCYTRSLDLAVENDCKSIAFSALSTGVYGYPSEEAAETAIEAVKVWLVGDESRAGHLERIVFCSFLEKDERAYEKFIP